MIHHMKLLEERVAAILARFSQLLRNEERAEMRS
jgi:hypothetical protein